MNLRPPAAQGGMAILMSALVALGVLVATWLHLPGHMDDVTEAAQMRLASIGLLGVPFPAAESLQEARPATSVLGGQTILWLAAMEMLPVALADVSGDGGVEVAAAHERHARALRAAGGHRFQVPY